MPREQFGYNKSLSELTDKTRAHAARLSYNNTDSPKWALLELSRVVDSKNIYFSDDLKELRNVLGATRKSTFKERLAWRLCGAIPNKI